MSDSATVGLAPPSQLRTRSAIRLAPNARLDII